MALTKDQIIAEAMSLSPEEREEVAEQIRLSLPDREIEQAWIDECHDRIEAVDRGQMRRMSADEVSAQARKILGK